MRPSSPPDLADLYRSLNSVHFDGALPDCQLLWNPRLRTTAGRVDVRRRVIEISVVYHQNFGPGEVRDTLLHEMIHLDQHRRRVRVGHSPEMKRIARRLGLRGLSARKVPSQLSPRYRYQCPVCSRQVLRRIRIGRNRSACAHCCNRHNGGRWHRRFVLVPVKNDKGRQT